MNSLIKHVFTLVPLHLAVEERCFKVVEALLSVGVNRNHQSEKGARNFGETPFSKNSRTVKNMLNIRKSLP